MLGEALRKPEMLQIYKVEAVKHLQRLLDQAKSFNKNRKIMKTGFAKSVA